MKNCKIIHINDGSAKKVENEKKIFVEEYQKAEQYINNYLSQGYEVKQIFQNITPNIMEEGNYIFFDSGFTVYLEKEV